MLARIASLLYVIADRDNDLEKVCKKSDVIMRMLMPSDWVGNEGKSTMKKLDPNQVKAHLQAMSAQMEKAFS